MGCFSVVSGGAPAIFSIGLNTAQTVMPVGSERLNPFEGEVTSSFIVEQV